MCIFISVKIPGSVFTHSDSVENLFRMQLELCIFRAWLRLRTFYFVGEIFMKKGISVLVSIMIILYSLTISGIVNTNAATSSNWSWPTYNHNIQNDWPNYPGGGYHAGTDFPVPLNTPVYSSCDGEVVSVLTHTGDYGKHIKIKAVVSGTIVYIRYAHLNSFAVNVGDKVTSGQLIAYSGSTGNSTGSSFAL